ncbi:DUF134 domain-containing protein [Williamwhitmania taraxaci]|nr:DUF134 domain-containing protein [Williamwhitmania taraxaci]
MSPRIKTIRKVLNPPLIKGFKPYGLTSIVGEPEPILLLFEEYEALRLCDYDMCNHIQASQAMGISRPTFTRIYSSARQKIAKAFVEGRQMSIEGGKVYFDSDWYACSSCHCFFNNPEREIEIKSCPLCNSRSIKNYDQSAETNTDNTITCEDTCICIQCGYEQVHVAGYPCAHEICPKCNSHLTRKSGRCRT